jgi:hypothetical protein
LINDLNPDKDQDYYELVLDEHLETNYEEISDTGKSLSEALIFASTNPQYDDRLFIELQVQYMKIPSSNLGRTCCVKKLFLTFKKFFVHNMFSPCSAKRRASDKDLPVQKWKRIMKKFWSLVKIKKFAKFAKIRIKNLKPLQKLMIT